MNNKTRKELSKIADKYTSIATMIEDLKTELEYIQEEEQDKYDNLPEQLQDTEKGNALYESAESIEELVNRLDDLATELYDIANDIEEVTNI